VELIGLDPGFFAFAVVAAFVAFVVGSTFGVGGAMILTASLLIGMPAPQAVAVIVPAMVANSLLVFWVNREHLDPGAAWRSAITVVPVAVVAALFTDLVNHATLQALVGLAILAALAAQYGLGRKLEISKRGLYGWGVVTGGVGGLAGTAGPPLALTFRSYGLHGPAFVATAAFVKVLLHVPRIPTYISTGLLDAELLPLALVITVMSIVGVAVGKKLLDRLEPARFRVALDVLLAVLGVMLIGGAIRAALGG
jgi:uncharacterized protein